MGFLDSLINFVVVYFFFLPLMRSSKQTQN